MKYNFPFIRQNKKFWIVFLFIFFTPNLWTAAIAKECACFSTNAKGAISKAEFLQWRDPENKWSREERHQALQKSFLKEKYGCPSDASPCQCALELLECKESTFIPSCRNPSSEVSLACPVSYRVPIQLNLNREDGNYQEGLDFFFQEFHAALKKYFDEQGISKLYIQTGDESLEKIKWYLIDYLIKNDFPVSDSQQTDLKLFIRETPTQYYTIELVHLSKSTPYWETIIRATNLITNRPLEALTIPFLKGQRMEMINAQIQKRMVSRFEFNKLSTQDNFFPKTNITFDQADRFCQSNLANGGISQLYAFEHALRHKKITGHPIVRFEMVALPSEDSEFLNKFDRQTFAPKAYLRKFLIFDWKKGSYFEAIRTYQNSDLSFRCMREELNVN